MSITELYKALADENRLRIVHALERGTFNVQELVQILELTQSNLSHHLKVLHSAGFIQSQKQGTWAYYRLSQESEAPLAFEMAQHELRIAQKNFYPLTQSAGDDQQRLQRILNQRREQARTFFDSVANKWQEMQEEIIDPNIYLPFVKQHASGEGTLVEFGCGSGIFLEQFLPRQGETIGIDYAPRMLDAAKRRLEQHNVDLRLGSLEHLPVPDKSVDVGIAHMVMHHVANPIEALQDAHRALKPGGTLVVADLVAHSNEEMRSRYADLWLGFDVNEFASWAKESGFCNAQIEQYSGDLNVFVFVAHKSEQ